MRAHLDHEKWALAALSYIRTNALEREVMDVQRHYRELVTCVERERCDHRTACELFANDLQNFRLTYRKFLQDWEDSYQISVIKPIKGFHDQCLRLLYIKEPELENVTPPDQVSYQCGPPQP